MDNWTQTHLESWLKSRFIDEEQDAARKAVVSFVKEYPELLDTRSWPEIYTLATR
jgi:hypothetical protein